MAVPVLSTEQENAVLKSINYSRKQLAQDMVLLREWLDAQDHFPESRKTEPEAFLANFIVGCKGSIEKAKTKLDKYYSIRGQGDLFLDRATLDYHHLASEAQCLAPLPKPLPDGSIVTMVALHNCSLEKYRPFECFKKMILYTEFRLRYGTGIYAGDVILLDSKRVSAAHAIKINPSYFKPLITWAQDALPFRIRKFLFFNTDPVLETVNNIFVRPFLKKGLKEKYLIVKDGDLTKYVECPDILPKCYGGKEADLMTLHEQFSKTFEHGLENILPTLDDRTDESKRPMLNGFADNPHFGAFGTIKTLVVD